MLRNKNVGSDSTRFGVILTFTTVSTQVLLVCWSRAWKAAPIMVLNNFHSRCYWHGLLLHTP